MPDENPNSGVEMAPVLARDGNIAVVHLPGRRFPGICLQGDTLWGVAQSLRLAGKHLSEKEGGTELKEATDLLLEALSLYVQTLRERGMALPFEEGN